MKWASTRTQKKEPDNRSDKGEGPDNRSGNCGISSRGGGCTVLLPASVCFLKHLANKEINFNLFGSFANLMPTIRFCYCLSWVFETNRLI